MLQGGWKPCRNNRILRHFTDRLHVLKIATFKLINAMIEKTHFYRYFDNDINLYLLKYGAEMCTYQNTVQKCVNIPRLWWLIEMHCVFNKYRSQCSTWDYLKWFQLIVWVDLKFTVNSFISINIIMNFNRFVL